MVPWKCLFVDTVVLASHNWACQNADPTARVEVSTARATITVGRLRARLRVTLSNW